MKNDKTNIFKYVFFIIVVILIGVAIYIVYKEQNEKTIIINNKKENILIYTDIAIGIAEYDTINPILTKNIDIQHITKLIFKSLLTITQDFQIKECLAEECSMINNKTYLIKLKENIYWHDGTNFTAEDVVFTIENLKRLKSDSIYKNNVAHIQETEILDTYIIKITLDKEIQFFKYMLCFPILAKHAYISDTLESKTENLIGTGEYKVNLINDKKIELIKTNENTKLEKINLYLYDTIVELYNNYSKGNIDIITTNNINYEKYTGTIGFEKKEVVGRGFGYIAINNQNSILTDREIRRAIAYAINKKEIIYNVFNNKYYIANFPLDYGSYLYNYNKEILEYNARSAQDIFTNNKWRYNQGVLQKNEDLFELKLVVNSDNPKQVLVATEIQGQLTNVGIKVNLIEANHIEYQNMLKTKNYDLIIIEEVVSTSPELNTYFGEDNLSNYNNNEINNLLMQLSNIDNIDILKEMYMKIIEIYEKEIPFISLYFNNDVVLYNKKIKGNMEANWYNLFYNIDSWYRIEK